MNKSLTFVCYPKCSTCTKATAWLDGRGINYELRDIKENNPNYEELKAWYATSGLPIKKWFNTSGLAYKALELKTKLPTMTDEACLRLLATDGMLVKRPILIGGGFVLVGFKEQRWMDKLG
jgi:arsenate reductase